MSSPNMVNKCSSLNIFEQFCAGLVVSSALACHAGSISGQAAIDCRIITIPVTICYRIAVALWSTHHQLKYLYRRSQTCWICEISYSTKSLTFLIQLRKLQKKITDMIWTAFQFYIWEEGSEKRFIEVEILLVGRVREPRLSIIPLLWMADW